MVNLESLLQQVFNFHDRGIDKSDSPETISGWDSFQSLIMFQELESASKKEFSVDDLKDIKTVGDICALLEKYNVEYSL